MAAISIVTCFQWHIGHTSRSLPSIIHLISHVCEFRLCCGHVHWLWPVSQTSNCGHPRYLTTFVHLFHLTYQPLVADDTAAKHCAPHPLDFQASHPHIYPRRMRARSNLDRMLLRMCCASNISRRLSAPTSPTTRALVEHSAHCVCSAVQACRHGASGCKRLQSMLCCHACRNVLRSRAFANASTDA